MIKVTLHDFESDPELQKRAAKGIEIARELDRSLTVFDHFDVPMEPDSEDGRATIAAMQHYVKTGELPKYE